MTAIAHDPDGKIAFTLGVVEDITERNGPRRPCIENAAHSSTCLSQRPRTATDPYEIHDGLAQELAGAIMQFQIYAQPGRRIRKKPPRRSMLDDDAPAKPRRGPAAD